MKTRSVFLFTGAVGCYLNAYYELGRSDVSFDVYTCGGIILTTLWLALRPDGAKNDQK